MGSLSKKLRSFASTDGTRAGIKHWCPGCQLPHVIYTKNPGGPAWEWDGDVDLPTCKPSVRCFTIYDEDGKPLPDGGQRTLCHYNLVKGVIEYCRDCGDHALSNQHVPLPDMPEGSA